MCGIAGILGIDSKERVKKMLNTIEHRGPDAKNIWKSNKNLSANFVNKSGFFDFVFS